jgi:hypothetical protein
MSAKNRDLLVLSQQGPLTQEELDKQLLRLNKVLSNIECWDQFCKANELIDLNRYKIIRNPMKIQQMLRDYPNRAFLFVCNKN